MGAQVDRLIENLYFLFDGFPYVIASVFSTPAFSIRAIYFCIFQSCIFHICCLFLHFPLLYFLLPHFQRSPTEARAHAQNGCAPADEVG